MSKEELIIWQKTREAWLLISEVLQLMQGVPELRLIHSDAAPPLSNPTSLKKMISDRRSASLCSFPWHGKERPTRSSRRALITVVK